jgi:hypothetical protein
MLLHFSVVKSIKLPIISIFVFTLDFLTQFHPSFVKPSLQVKQFVGERQQVPQLASHFKHNDSSLVYTKVYPALHYLQ